MDYSSDDEYGRDPYVSGFHQQSRYHQVFMDEDGENLPLGNFENSYSETSDSESEDKLNHVDNLEPKISQKTSHDDSSMEDKFRAVYEDNSVPSTIVVNNKTSYRVRGQTYASHGEYRRSNSRDQTRGQRARHRPPRFQHNFEGRLDGLERESVENSESANQSRGWKGRPCRSRGNARGNRSDKRSERRSADARDESDRRSMPDTETNYRRANSRHRGGRGRGERGRGRNQNAEVDFSSARDRTEHVESPRYNSARSSAANDSDKQQRKSYAEITQEIFLHILQNYDGVVALEDIESFFGSIAGHQYRIMEWFIKNSNFKVFENNNDPSKSMISAFQNGLKLCTHYTSPIGCNKTICNYLHLCRNHVTGNCDRFNCKHNHDVEDDHNMKVRNKFKTYDFINQLIETEILRLIRCSTLQICVAYNSMGCEYATEATCPYVHICRDFIVNQCRDAHCHKRHDFDESRDTIRLYGLSSVNDGFLRKMVLLPPDCDLAPRAYAKKNPGTEKSQKNPGTYPPHNSGARGRSDRRTKSPKRTSPRSAVISGAIAGARPGSHAQDDVINYKSIGEYLFKSMLQKYDGCLDMSILCCVYDKIPSHETAYEVYKHNRDKFKLFERESQSKRDAVLVVHKAGLQLCVDHISEIGCLKQRCHSVHLCKRLAEGKCPSATACHFNHDIHSDHNRNVLQLFNLIEYSAKDIWLLIQCCSLRLCGDHIKLSRCDPHENGMCPYLHLCPRYIANNCTDVVCKLGHSFAEASVKRTLSKYLILIPDEQTLKQMILFPSWYEHPKPVKTGKSATTFTSGDIVKPKSTLTSIDQDLFFLPNRTHPPLVSSKQHRESQEDKIESPRRASVGTPTDAPQAPFALAPGYVTLQDGPVADNAHSSNALNPGENDSDEQTNDIHGQGTGIRLHELSEGIANTDSSVTLDSDTTDSLQLTSNVHIRDADVDICEEHLRGECKDGHACANHHCDTPYVWQIERHGEWETCDRGEEIECAFSQPWTMLFKVKHGQEQATYQIYFENMLALCEVLNKNCRVRRLSTASYVRGEARPSFYTLWLWYWQENDKEWLLYGLDNEGPPLDIMELRYLDRANIPQLHFELQQKQMCLDLVGMQQTNLDTGARRAVRRRPHYVSSYNVVCQLMPPEPELHCDWSSLPQHWAAMVTTPSATHKFVQIRLPKSHAEYTKVMKQFNSTIGNRTSFSITRVHRIQNPVLWRAYSRKCEELQIKHPSLGDALEKQLFHGTDSATVPGICHQNVDPRMHGKNATLYGCGAYFARTARYSDSYTSRMRTRHMFLARVLVGRYTAGNSSLKRPPPLHASAPHGELYDSCVDDVANPSIYVVFERDQCYPEYLIEYQKIDLIDHSLPRPTLSPGISRGLASHPAYSQTSTNTRTPIPGISINSSNTNTSNTGVHSPTTSYSYPSSQHATASGATPAQVPAAASDTWTLLDDDIAWSAPNTGTPASGPRPSTAQQSGASSQSQKKDKKCVIQ